MIFKNENVYKTLKKIWQYVIPAIAYLWFKIADIWSIPCGDLVFATIVAVWAAMAIFLGISKWNYMKVYSNLPEELLNGIEVDEENIETEEVEVEGEEIAADPEAVG